MMFKTLDPRRAMFMTALLSLPLCFAGCAVDDGDLETEVQAVGGLSCKLFRPVTWTGFAATCREASDGPPVVVLADGDTYHAVSAPGPGLGTGDATIQCVNGKLQTIDRHCVPGSAR
jgi:hypothetical protein